MTATWAATAGHKDAPASPIVNTTADPATGLFHSRTSQAPPAQASRTPAVEVDLRAMAAAPATTSNRPAPTSRTSIGQPGPASDRSGSRMATATEMNAMTRLAATTEVLPRFPVWTMC